jgi:hypothetical protein
MASGGRLEAGAWFFLQPRGMFVIPADFLAAGAIFSLP